MPSRTQIICLHEGRDGRSIDPLFIRILIKKLKPAWISPWPGNNVIRTEGCRGRTELIEATPRQLKAARAQGNQVTLMVWADLVDDMPDPEALKKKFWEECEDQGISRTDFDTIVFAFAKDRLENWIEFLNEGSTDESVSGPRLKHHRPVAEAAKKLAKLCLQGNSDLDLPESLQWSCLNWRKLGREMR